MKLQKHFVKSSAMNPPEPLWEVEGDGYAESNGGWDGNENLRNF